MLAPPAHRPGHRRSAGPADKQPLLARQAAGHQCGVFVGYLNELINHRKIHIRGQNILADALGQIRIHLGRVNLAGGLVAGEQRAVSINAEGEYFRILLLQIPRHPAHGTAGADARRIMRKPPFGVAPDFRAGGGVMRIKVGGVVVLIRIIGAFNLLTQPPGDRIV